MAQNHDFAGGGLEQSFQDFYGCGLPRSIRAEKAEAFPSLNFQTQRRFTDSFDVARILAARIQPELRRLKGRIIYSTFQRFNLEGKPGPFRYLLRQLDITPAKQLDRPSHP